MQTSGTMHHGLLFNHSHSRVFLPESHAERVDSLVVHTIVVLNEHLVRVDEQVVQIGVRLAPRVYAVLQIEAYELHAELGWFDACLKKGAHLLGLELAQQRILVLVKVERIAVLVELVDETAHAALLRTCCFVC